MACYSKPKWPQHALLLVVISALAGAAGCGKKTPDGAVASKESAKDTAVAMDPSCKPIADAELAQRSKPAYRIAFVSTVSGKTTRHESILTADKMFFHTEGSAWTKSPFSMQRANQDALKELSRNPPFDCKQTGSETINGVQTSVYQYQNKISKTLTAQHKLWIGADGLPHKRLDSFTDSQVEATFNYSDVSPPVQ